MKVMVMFRKFEMTFIYIINIYMARISLLYNVQEPVHRLQS